MTVQPWDANWAASGRPILPAPTTATVPAVPGLAGPRPDGRGRLVACTGSAAAGSTPPSRLRGPTAGGRSVTWPARRRRRGSTGRTVRGRLEQRVGDAHGPRPVLAVDDRRAARRGRRPTNASSSAASGSRVVDVEVDDVARERRGVAGDQRAARRGRRRGERQALGQVVELEHALLADDAQLAALGGRQPVDVEHARRARREVQQPEQQVLVRLRGSRWASLGVDAHRPLARDPRQDVGVMRGEVDRHADVADPGRERAGAPAGDGVHGREPARRAAAGRARARPG